MHLESPSSHRDLQIVQTRYLKGLFQSRVGLKQARNLQVLLALLGLL